VPDERSAAFGPPEVTTRARPVRVLVVDDSVVVRRLLTDTLSVDPGIEVVGVAANGKIALQKVTDLRPDVVVLDLDMPEMNGITFARTLRARELPVSIIVFAAAVDGQESSVHALDAGADEYVAKPHSSAGLVTSQQMILAQLAPRIKALGARRGIGPARRRPSDGFGAPPFVPGPVSPALAAVLAESGVDLAPRPPGPAPARTRPYVVLVIGSSTGGPDALAEVARGLPGNLPVPVVIVQHMPPKFTEQLAIRLDKLTGLQVSEAREDDAVAPGRVLVAPGGRHLELARTGTGLRVRLTDGPQENFCRPAVDVLFRTAAAVCGDGVIGAVLTGMGRDGQQGARLIRAAGGTVLAQDAATSVVWGMPGSVVQAGLADAVLPVKQIGGELAARIMRCARPRG